MTRLGARAGVVTLVAAAVQAAAVMGCGGAARTESSVAALRQLVEQAKARGAYACAPTELALGEAHVRFAEDELALGDAARAAEHVILAEPNLKAAITLSPAGRCDGSAKGDRDGDGIDDERDRCPDQPEDFDGDADEDGCADDADSDGDSVVDSRDLCALEPEDADAYLDSDGCPEPDNDLDQVLDDADRCPADPEDRDGFEDADGCPEPDNDGDGLSDVDDACPNEPGAADRSGCPREYKDVRITGTEIEISQKIYFDTNRAVIQGRSFAILDTVAVVLTDYPNVTVEIQGHTDSRGPDAKNRALSDQRANAVRAYLLGRGIAPERLTARGYGEERPIDSNATPAGRDANRRVEFVRTDSQRGGTP